MWATEAAKIGAIAVIALTAACTKHSGPDARVGGPPSVHASCSYVEVCAP
jgi:hypothetical protein